MKRFFALASVVVFAACSNGPSGGSSSGSSSTGGKGASSGSASSSGGKATTGSSTSGGSSSGGISTGSSGGSTSGAVTTGGSTTGASGGSSGGSSGTTGAQTPVSNQGCGTSASPVGEFLGCTTNADCACPLSCQADPGIAAGTTVCVYPCSTSADCSRPTTFCQGGACLTKQCAFANGSQGIPGDAGFWAPCDGDGVNDGICFPAANANFDVIGVCQLTGTLPLGSACSPSPDRDAGLAALCGQGAECLNAETSQIQSPPPFTCQAVCDPNAAIDMCADGGACIVSPIAGTEDGELQGFAGGEAAYGICTARGASGCPEAVLDFETLWNACSSGANCACDQSCISNPASQTTACAEPCSATADCSDPATTCQGGFCWPNVTCDGGGPLAAPCTAVSGSDGVCLHGSELPEDVDPALFTGGANDEVCVQVGSAAAGASCDPNFPSRAADAGALCQAGLVCTPQLDGGGLCQRLCPLPAWGIQAPCPSGQECELVYFDRGPLDVPFTVGACFPQGASGCAEGWATPGPGASCSTNHDCPCPTGCVSGTCQ